MGYLVAATAGYLGGDLVYHHRIGVDRSETSLEPRDFVPVIATGDLPPDQPRQRPTQRGGGGPCPSR